MTYSILQFYRMGFNKIDGWIQSNETVCYFKVRLHGLDFIERIKFKVHEDELTGMELMLNWIVWLYINCIE